MGKKIHGEYSIEIFGDYCIEIDNRSQSGGCPVTREIQGCRVRYSQNHFLATTGICGCLFRRFLKLLWCYILVFDQSIRCFGIAPFWIGLTKTIQWLFCQSTDNFYQARCSSLISQTGAAKNVTCPSFG